MEINLFQLEISVKFEPIIFFFKMSWRTAFFLFVFYLFFVGINTKCVHTAPDISFDGVNYPTQPNETPLRVNLDLVNFSASIEIS
jgi:hypothetical protein